MAPREKKSPVGFGQLLRGLLAAVLLGAGVLPLQAQLTLPGKGRFQIDVSCTRYAAGEAAVYTEISYGIRQDCFAHRGDPGHFAGAVNMRAEIWTDSGLVSRREWSVPHVLADTSKLSKATTIVGLETFRLMPGRYRVVVAAYDVLESSRRDSVVLSVPVRPFAGRGVVFSDVELSTDIHSSADTTSMFYKNTLEVVPNPGALFGAMLPFLYYYVEMYGLEHHVGNGRLLLSSTIRNSFGEALTRSERPQQRVAGPSVALDKLNVTALKSGTYMLNVALRDSAGQEVASASKKFYIFKPGTVPDSARRLPPADYTASEYMVMTADELDLEMQQIRYAATPAEMKQTELLKDLPSKRNFLFEFWGRRETDQRSPTNEFKTEYRRRIADANAAYTNSFRAGWKTDRGRVSILYGMPDEVERFPSSSESNPYEIWHYNSLQGGVIFVFVDRSGMSDYVQVHSTHRDELRNENWFAEWAQKMH